MFKIIQKANENKMNKKTSTLVSMLLVLGIFMTLSSCSNTSKIASTSTEVKTMKEEIQKTLYPSDVTPFFQHFNLILGNGKNAGQAVDLESKDFFYATNDGKTDWVVYKTPNAGDTHGTSNNTRTELAQLKKWSHVANTGDARVAATYSMVVGQIHSADGHENEPLKIFYKKFPGHDKGSVFWNYEINTAGEDNGGRWDYSLPVWGYDFSDVGPTADSYPPEPKDGIKLGEEFSYVVEVKDGIMNLTFTSAGHETKTFSKNLIVSEYTKPSDMPEQVKGLFVPIGQDGVEVENAYEDEGLFFKLGSYNQTNGKSPDLNGVWCSGAETHGGDIQKQYADGNYAEVWFKESSVLISEDAYSNEEYFTNNDFLRKRTEDKKEEEKK